MCKHKNGLFLFYANSLPGRRFVMSGSVSPLPWTGNKGCIYTTIDAFMPPHRTYVEACMGSAEVFLRKSRLKKKSSMTTTAIWFGSSESSREMKIWKD